MSDRLQELLRQRAAIHAHLAWLDREIAHARSFPAPAANADSTPLPSPLPAVAPEATPPVVSSDAATNPDTLLATYQQDAQALRTDVRKGCLLYFFGAFLLLGLGIVSFYFVNRLIHQQPDSAPSGQRVAPDPER